MTAHPVYGPPLDKLHYCCCCCYCWTLGDVASHIDDLHNIAYPSRRRRQCRRRRHDSWAS